MLMQARLKKLPRHSLVLAAAEAMPHPGGTFDRVVTRYSLHHMQDPAPVMREIYRVCRSGGQAMVIDIVSPEDEGTAELYNHLERLRDPSHTTALSPSALEALAADAGFSFLHSTVIHRGELDVEYWFDLSETPDEARQIILAALKADLDGQQPSGFKPFYYEGRLKFAHTVATLIGVKA
jgi:SAM-dependent methyltransferase